MNPTYEIEIVRPEHSMAMWEVYLNEIISYGRDTTGLCGVRLSKAHSKEEAITQAHETLLSAIAQLALTGRSEKPCATP